MHSKRSGFTLIELLVVVLILGVLASVAAPSYMKTVETSRATDSVGMAAMVANAQRMCLLDNVSNPAKCNPGIISASNPLVQNKYLTDSGWTSAYYSFYSCTPGGYCCGGSGYGCSIRTSGKYAGWGYYLDASGVCHELASGTPKCPNL